MASLAELSKLKSEGPFAPLSLDRGTVVFPGFDGGAEWGGAAFDPETGLLVFTRRYHLRRGYCCESGCRHCPYKGTQAPEPGGP